MVVEVVVQILRMKSRINKYTGSSMKIEVWKWTIYMWD